MQFEVSIPAHDFACAVESDTGVHVDGAPVAIREDADGSLRVRIGASDYRVLVARENDELVAYVAGARLAVRAERAIERAAREILKVGKRHDADEVVRVTAPMPGLVRTVVAVEGAAVVSGEVLLTLEAMKMENEIRSACAGTVRAVRVRVGEAIEKGRTLVELVQA